MLMNLRRSLRRRKGLVMGSLGGAVKEKTR
jgi:hypothetical protein